MIISRKPLLILAALIGAAWCGNFLHLPLYVGVDFIFGSIAVMLVLALYGLRWGVLAALISASYTLFLWGHPYALIIFVLEALVVGVALKRNPVANIALMDGLFWLVLGIPLSWLLHYGVVGFDETGAAVIALKQASNGLFNALIASFLLAFTPLRRHAGNTAEQSGIPLQHALSNLLALFMMVPVVVILLMQNRQQAQQIDAGVATSLHTYSNEVATELVDWQQRSLQAVRSVEKIAQNGPVTGQDLGLIKASYVDIGNILVADVSGRILASAVPQQGPSHLDEAWLPELRVTQKSVISNIFQDPVLGVPVIHLRAPILERAYGKRTLRGFIVVSLQLGFPQGELIQHAEGKNIRATLLDRTDRVMATTRPDLRPLQVFSGLQAGARRPLSGDIQQWQPGRNGPALDWKGSFYVLEHRLGPDFPGKLVVDLAATPYLIALQQANLQAFELILATAMLAFVLGGVASRKLVQPLRQLTEAAVELRRRGARGLENPLPRSEMLEMQQLVLHFNGMAQALSKSHGEMESLVQSRTSELAEANQKLQTEILKRREFEKELQNYALQLAGTADDLRQKEKEQAVLLANIPDLVIFRDAEGRYCYVNPAFERVAGIKLESVIGRTCDVLFDAAGARFSRMYDLQSRESRKTVVAELQLAAKGNGEARDYLTTRSPLFDEAGEFQGTIAVFHDITVRKRDEAALAHVMAELQSLKVALDQHAIVSIADVSGNITYANAKFNEVSQYGQEELLGHNHRLLNSGLHPKEFWIEMWVTISQGKVWHDVIRNRKKDGSFYWVDSTIVPFLDANCVPYQYVSIRTDITQMKLAEESLQGLNLRLKMLNASSDALIHVGEENALLQEICDIVVEIGGYPMAWVGLAEDDAEKTVRSVASAGFGKEYVDLVNVTWGEGHMSGEGPVGTAIRSAVPCVIADVNADPAFSPWRELAKERGYRSVAALPLEVEGQIVGALAVYASEPDAFGQEELGALAELVADMGFGIKSLRVQSEKNRLLEALRHSHERWNQIFELSPDPTSLRRLSDGIYLEVNDAFCRAFGYQSEAVIGHDAVELGIWVDREEYQAMARGIAEHGQVNGQEVRLRSGTGEIRWATLSATALDYAGERCILAVSHDITERKRSALVLSQAKDAAEQASRAKSEFLARMSHELRTPLNAILGFAQLLEHDPKVPLEAGQRDSVQHIIKGGWYLLQLINDVLDLSRIEAGRMTINTEPVEVGRLLRDCLKLVAPAAAEKRGIVMHNQVPELQQLWVKADPVRLKQIVLNLLSNAVKYNRQSGSVTLGIQQTENDFLRISVTDQGPGISAQQQTQLFASFSRLDADKKGIDGTGIGLSIAKNMVELMGGRIGLESEVGSGSTFWIELPQASGPTDGEMGGKVQPDDFIPRKNDAAPCVLYIDGMLPNQELMRMLLGQHRPDIRLILAATGEAGLEAARMEIPSMILVDFGLSDMEGLDLLNALRYDPDTSAIPVFALCSNIYPEKLEQAKQVGLAGHFTKPVDIRQLLSTLAEVVPK